MDGGKLQREWRSEEAGYLYLEEYWRKCILGSVQGW